MSKNNVTVEPTMENDDEKIIEKPVETVDVAVKKDVTTKESKPVIALSAATQKMNARQFFAQYPHDNAQVVALIIALYGNKTKTVAEWEAFYQQMLKKKVN